MAYTEQTFTNLGSVQAPDASQSTAFAGSTPFAFSEGTNQLLNQVTQQAVKRREDEVKMYNDNLQAALSKASNIAEGLSAQDYDEAKSKSKKAIKYIYDNPQILLGKDPEKSNEFNNMLVDIASYTQLSKATKKIEDNYNDLIKKDSDWNNEVNNYYLQQYRNTTDPNERAKMAFTPIKNPLGDFQTLVVPKLQQNAPIETRTEVDPNDKGKLIVYQDKIFDEGVYKEAFKNYNGAYLTEEWNVRPDIQQQYATPDEYIEFKAKETFVPKATSKSSVTNNVSFVEGQKNERNEASIEGRATEGAANRSVRLQIAKEKASPKNPEYKNIAPILNNIDGFESNVLKTVEATPAIEKMTGIKKYKEVNPAFINETIIKGVYPNGASQYGDAYGKLYIVTDAKGNSYYAPAKELFKVKGKPATKEEYEAAQKISPTSVSKEVLPNNDKGRQYTKETLLGSAVDNTVNGRFEYDIWKKNNQAVQAIEKESNTGIAPKSASAEKQLENPKVNQLLKASYMDLKKKYPTIDTNGIIGDASHKERDSDHNTMDAIDIVNFGDKSSSVITDLQKDGNVKYIIFNKQIWNPKDGWKAYSGKNPHKDHIHVSYKDDGVTATTIKTENKKGKYKFNPKTGKLELQ